jgi:cytochrome d ubiquinol oxidase subunit II
MCLRDTSLVFIFVGVAITVPAIIVYTIYMYRVFWGPAEPLSYGKTSADY